MRGSKSSIRLTGVKIGKNNVFEIINSYFTSHKLQCFPSKGILHCKVWLEHDSFGVVGIYWPDAHRREAQMRVVIFDVARLAEQRTSSGEQRIRPVKQRIGSAKQFLSRLPDVFTQSNIQSVLGVFGGITVVDFAGVASGMFFVSIARQVTSCA